MDQTLGGAGQCGQLLGRFGLSQYYRTLKVGPIVGEPVPGTGTMVYAHTSRLIPGLAYGIPTLGLRNPDGTLYENQELIPTCRWR